MNTQGEDDYLYAQERLKIGPSPVALKQNQLHYHHGLRLLSSTAVRLYISAV